MGYTPPMEQAACLSQNRDFSTCMCRVLHHTAFTETRPLFVRGAQRQLFIYANTLRWPRSVAETPTSGRWGRVNYITNVRNRVAACFLGESRPKWHEKFVRRDRWNPPARAQQDYCQTFQGQQRLQRPLPVLRERPLTNARSTHTYDGTHETKNIDRSPSTTTTTKKPTATKDKTALSNETPRKTRFTQPWQEAEDAI